MQNGCLVYRGPVPSAILGDVYSLLFDSRWPGMSLCEQYKTGVVGVELTLSWGMIQHNHH